MEKGPTQSLGLEKGPTQSLDHDGEGTLMWVDRTEVDGIVSDECIAINMETNTKSKSYSQTTQSPSLNHEMH